jgi:heptose-I-phosphate ethanolaminephosphotransferase
VRSSNGVSLTYVSDHGEALGESSGFFGHVDGPMPKQVYQIPLFFDLSRSATSQLGGRLHAFQQNLSRPFQTDWLIHSLLDLYGVKTSEWRPERSMFSESFASPARYCDDLVQ